MEHNSSEIRSMMLNPKDLRSYSINTQSLWIGSQYPDGGLEMNQRSSIHKAQDAKWGRNAQQRLADPSYIYTMCSWQKRKHRRTWSMQIPWHFFRRLYLSLKVRRKDFAGDWLSLIANPIGDQAQTVDTLNGLIKVMKKTWRSDKMTKKKEPKVGRLPATMRTSSYKRPVFVVQRTPIQHWNEGRICLYPKAEFWRKTLKTSGRQE